MMAIETMLDLEPRSDEVRDHVDRLIAETAASSLPDNEIRSIAGSLSWLEVDGRAGSLELFVRDLLSLCLLHRIPD
jgi:hypothetical protein